MATSTQRQDERGRTLLLLNTAIGTLDLENEATLMAPVNTIFGSARALLIVVRVSTPGSCRSMAG